MKRTSIIKTAILLLSLAFVFSGCSDNDDNFTFRIVKSDVEFDAGGGTGTISFVAHGEVKVESDKEWLKPASPESTSVSFTVDENTAILGRTAIITLTGNGTSEIVTVTQLGAILVPAETYEISAVSKTTQFPLYANTGNVIVTAADSWVNVSVTDGNLVVLPELNSGQERSTTLTFTAGWKTTTAILTQRPFVDIATVSLLAKGNAVSFTLSDDIMELDPAWTVQGNAPWLHVSKSDTKITVTADVNDTGSLRTSNLSITAGSMTLVVPVKQSGITDYYSYFLGQWTLLYDNGDSRVNVTLEQNVYNESYIMKGLYKDVIVTYDNASKQMGLVTQFVGMYESTLYTYFCPANTEGFYTWISGYGFTLIFNYDETNNFITISDNGAWDVLEADVFMFYVFSGNPPTSNNGEYSIIGYSSVVGMYR